MQKLTKQQAIIISAYTGFTACNIGDVHEAVEKKLGRPIWIHQFGDEAMMEEIRDAFREDFLAICYKD